MRLKTIEINSIKEIINRHYNNAIIYLFGSRVDESKKGGDIDLYILLDKKPHFLDKPTLLASLKRSIGEQKIDLVFGYPQKKSGLIDKEALSKGIKL